MAADQSTEFFESLRRREHEPLLEQTVGTLRFDLTRGDGVDRWLVAIDKGDLTVSQQRRRADCTVRAPKALFDRVASGEVNAMAAVMRGAIEVEGDPELLTLLERLFPGPARKAGGKP